MGKENLDELVFNPNDFVELKKDWQEYYKAEVQAILRDKQRIVDAFNAREIIAKNGVTKYNKMQIEEFDQVLFELNNPSETNIYSVDQSNESRIVGHLKSAGLPEDEIEKIEKAWIVIYDSVLFFAQDSLVSHDPITLKPGLVREKYEPFFETDQADIAMKDFIEFKKMFPKSAKSIIEEHQKEIKEIKEIKDNFEFALKKFKKELLENPDDRKELKEKGQNVLYQIKSLSEQVQNEYDHENIKKLTEILDTCNEVLLTPSKNKQEMITLATKLAQTSQEVSGKASPFWKDIAKGLLLFACAALVVACVLAAIPTGGSSLLIAAIGVAGIGVAAGLTSSVALHKSKETGLAKSITEYKQTLFKEIRQEKKSHDNPEQPSPALPNR